MKSPSCMGSAWFGPALGLALAMYAAACTTAAAPAPRCASDGGCAGMDAGTDASGADASGTDATADAAASADGAADASAPDTGADAGPSAMLGDYAGALTTTTSGGVVHVDTARTIARLVGAHVSTYAYLVMTQTQWDDLPAFADAAAAAGIAIDVYLVPPTESSAGGSHSSIPPGSRTPNYPPYQWDYVAWARAIGALAAMHPNVRGIMVDDFATNTAEYPSPYTFRFTPAYVRSMMSAARASAAWLTFSPVLYYPSYGGGSIAEAYRTSIDGVVFPYRAESTGAANTHDATHASAEGRYVSAMVRCHGGATCYQLAFPGGTASTAGQYAAISQTITVQPSASYTLSFWTSDDYVSSSTSGYHRIQAVLDGVVVADQDVAGNSDWHQVSVDVTHELMGRSSATLELRLYEQTGVSNFHVSVWLDDVGGTGITVTNPGFETTGAWRATENGAAFSETAVPSVDVFFMTYAERLYVEGVANPTYRTSASYVQSVVGTALTLMHQNVVDGSLVYVLDLTGADTTGGAAASYGDVAALYAAY